MENRRQRGKSALTSCPSESDSSTVFTRVGEGNSQFLEGTLSACLFNKEDRFARGYAKKEGDGPNKFGTFFVLVGETDTPELTVTEMLSLYYCFSA